MKNIIWDEFGMILQTGDGGDTAANMGTYHIFIETRRRMGHRSFFDGYYPHKEKEDFQKARAALEHPVMKNLGLYRRHPNERFWGSRCNTMSRDQTIPLLGAMALYGMKKEAFEFILGHFFRAFLFATNTTPNWSDPVLHQPKKFGWGVLSYIRFFFGWDPGYPVYATKLPDFTLFEFWALELRAIYEPYLWPLLFPILCILDLFTVISSATKVFLYGKDPTNSDDRNHVNCMLIGLQVCCTPTMVWAAKLYSTRPRAESVGPDKVVDTDGVGNLIYEGVSGPQSALDHYYRAENSPPFNELGRPIIKHYFEGKVP